jgi:hypothetical protein
MVQKTEQFSRDGLILVVQQFNPAGQVSRSINEASVQHRRTDEANSVICAKLHQYTHTQRWWGIKVIAPLGLAVRTPTGSVTWLVDVKFPTAVVLDTQYPQ